MCLAIDTSRSKITFWPPLLPPVCYTHLLQSLVTVFGGLAFEGPAANSRMHGFRVTASVNGLISWRLCTAVYICILLMWCVFCLSGDTEESRICRPWICTVWPGAAGIRFGMKHHAVLGLNNKLFCVVSSRHINDDIYYISGSEVDPLSLLILLFLFINVELYTQNINRPTQL